MTSSRILGLHHELFELNTSTTTPPSRHRLSRLILRPWAPLHPKLRAPLAQQLVSIPHAQHNPPKGPQQHPMQRRLPQQHLELPVRLFDHNRLPHPAARKPSTLTPPTPTSLVLYALWGPCSLIPRNRLPPPSTPAPMPLSHSPWDQTRERIPR